MTTKSANPVSNSPTKPSMNQKSVEGSSKNRKIPDREVRVITKEMKIEGLGLYEGQVSVEKNVPHGRGRLEMNNGDCYVGDFFEGKMQGEGILEDVEGNFYEGEFVDGMKHGKGVEEYNSDLKHGKMVFGGKFKNDKKHGYGKSPSPSTRYSRTFLS